MPKVTFVEPSGRSHVVEVPAGVTVMESATRNAVPGIEGACGGACACATCHVYVDAAWSEATGAAGAVEDSMLHYVEERRLSSRLSCQITMTTALDGLVVHLPEDQLS